MHEIWRRVAGFERYEVSDAGRVRSWHGTGRHLHLRATPLVLKPIRRGEYLGVSLCDTQGQRRAYIHHLVAEAFIGPRPDGQEVRHLNGDRFDCRAGNLAYGLHVENVRDTVRHGTAWWQNPATVARRTAAWRASMQKRKAA